MNTPRRHAAHGRLTAPRPQAFDDVYLNAAGLFMPGEPVANDDIDRYIAPLNRASARIKTRVLADNGIRTRHYAIDEQGRTTVSVARMAANAIHDCLQGVDTTLNDVTLLCTGSSSGDLGLPGLAAMVHGELASAPMAISSHHGVCAAGLQALAHAAQGLQLGAHEHALVATAEMPSRLFKHQRYATGEYRTDFDAHFLRWMLSDGAAACLLGRAPRAYRDDLPAALRLRWLHTRSFAGDHPVCMQIGLPAGRSDQCWLDYPTLAEAERDGAFLVRQDIRLLPNLFEVAIHEYAALVRAGHVQPDEVDHFLCHYSSQKLGRSAERLMHDAGLHIPRSRWYSNLATRGNTGAASIFIMLADFLRERRPAAGEKILCFVPESGRFTVGFMLLEVAGEPAARVSVTPTAQRSTPAAEDALPPHDPATAATPATGRLLRELAGTWHDYRSRAWRTPLFRRIADGTLERADYLRWMACWIPQVREGSGWMREAAASLRPPYDGLRPLVEAHAGDEQDDYRMLFEDYRAAGGNVTDIDCLRRNAGGEALNAYLHARAAAPNPLGLLGAIYIIEGTGQRIVPLLLPRLRYCVDLPDRGLRFLRYHGENDMAHLQRWLRAVAFVLARDDDGGAARDIASVAADTAALYLMQLEQSI